MPGKSGWVQYLLSPVIVGCIMLLGQSWLQPIIAEKTRAKTERWEAKREVFINTIALVDKEFGATSFTIGIDVPKVKVKLSSPPSANEKNRCYRELLLYTKGREIIYAFIGCLGAREGQEMIWHKEKIRMIQLMRRELGFDEINLREVDVRFFMEKVDTEK